MNQNFKCAIPPAQAWMPRIRCTPRSIAKPVPLLLLQKNWLCASRDDSLLPPTALAELITGGHKATAGTKLHPRRSLFHLLLLLLQLRLSFSLFVTFLHCNWQKKKTQTQKNWRGSSLPVDKPDETLKPLCAPRVPELQNNNHLSRNHGNSAISPHDNTTICLDNTKVVKEQRLWLHVRPSVTLGGWSRDY